MNNNNNDIEVGKCYRTRDGNKVRILVTNRRCENNMSVVGLIFTGFIEEVGAWRSNGCFSYENHPFDLISAWYDPPAVDWATLPAWARYAGQNKDKTWHWYQEQPKQLNAAWMSYNNSGTIPDSYAPVYSGPWWDSLVERPAEAKAEAD